MVIRRFTALFISSVLLIGGSVPACASGSVSSEAALSVSESAESPAGSPDQVLPDLIEGLNEDELLNAMTLILKVGSSPELKELMAYVEVQDLVKEVAVRAIRFIYTDRELSRKILQTLDVEDKVIDFLMLLVDATEDKQEAVIEFINSGQCEEILANLDQYVDGDALMSAMLEKVENIGVSQ